MGLLWRGPCHTSVQTPPVARAGTGGPSRVGGSGNAGEPGGRLVLMGASRLRWPSLLMLVALAVGACSGSSSAQGTQTPRSSTPTTATVPVKSPSPSSSTSSASDGRPTEAEVKAAYMNFRKVTDGVLLRGGKDAEADLRKVALEPQLNVLLDRAASYQR